MTAYFGIDLIRYIQDLLMEVVSTLLSITFCRLAPIFGTFEGKWMLHIISFSSDSPDSNMKGIWNPSTTESQHWIRSRFRELRRIQPLALCCVMNTKWCGCQKYIHWCSHDAEVVQFGNHSFIPNEKGHRFCSLSLTNNFDKRTLFNFQHIQHVSAAFIHYFSISPPLNHGN